MEMSYHRIKIMQRRHFIVKRYDNHYHLKEVDAAIGNSIHQFGAMTGHFYSVEATHWTFYFLHTNITIEEADAVAARLAQRFMALGAAPSPVDERRATQPLAIPTVLD